MAEKRCWPGYEPVPGKPKHSQGSCRPKAKSKSTKSERSFRTKRKRQLDRWKRKHPKSRRSAAQHLRKPARRTRTTGRKTVARRTSAKRSRKKS